MWRCKYSCLDHHNSIVLELLSRILFPWGFGKNIFIKDFKVLMIFYFKILILIQFPGLQCPCGFWSWKCRSGRTIPGNYWHPWRGAVPGVHLCWRVIAIVVEIYQRFINWFNSNLLCFRHFVPEVFEFCADGLSAFHLEFEGSAAFAKCHLKADRKPAENMNLTVINNLLVWFCSF